ncbi:hypothetical protein [Streptomyces sp. NPDC001250]|uniref:hypothetical protein n=1 Tax=unclassified Streptomyces TaxID=2593676 RepID=UPI00332F5FE1
MSDIPFSCTIANRAYDELRMQSSTLSMGRWLMPPEPVPGRKEATAIGVIPQARSPYLKGQAVYQLGSDEAAWVKIGWDIPGISGTTSIVNVETSHPDIIATLDGFIGSSEREDITLIVADVRTRPNGSNGGSNGGGNGAA